MLIFIVIVMCIILLLSACSPKMDNNYIQGNKIVLNKNEIKQISISTNNISPPLAINLTNEEQIFTVADYLTVLDISETNLDQQQYSGLWFEIEIKSKDNSGGYFVLGDKGFSELVVNICESNQSKKGEPLIEGTIISMIETEDGSDISCVIRDKHSLDHNIYVKNAEIISVDGTTVLHINDTVKAFIKPAYDKSAEIEASTIYIHNSVQEVFT